MNIGLISSIIKSLGISHEDEHFDIVDAILHECITIIKTTLPSDEFVPNIDTLLDFTIASTREVCVEEIKQHFGIE